MNTATIIVWIAMNLSSPKADTIYSLQADCEKNKKSAEVCLQVTMTVDMSPLKVTSNSAVTGR